MIGMAGDRMAFSATEKAQLLALKGVGPTVIQRFEEIGIDSLAQLAGYNADDIAGRVAEVLRSSCWKNSPQARAAINAAIQLAQQSQV